MRVRLEADTSRTYEVEFGSSGFRAFLAVRTPSRADGTAASRPRALLAERAAANLEPGPGHVEVGVAETGPLVDTSVAC